MSRESSGPGASDTISPREHLASLEFHGIRLGLENITRLMEAAGHPHRAYPTIHIAGTNGKGSVAAFAAAMLRAAGYRTGLYTSPHLMRLNERMVIGGKPISDEALDDSLRYFQFASAGWDPPPTYFEFATATAFRAFEQAGIDVGVIEVGMGGRFDATNVLCPLICCITQIDYDHMQYLGETLEKIAFEKAGIIKTGIPVVIAEEKAGPRGVLLEAAHARGAPAIAAAEAYTWRMLGVPMQPRLEYRGPRIRLNDVPLALAGSHQAQNGAAAAAIGEVLLDHFEAFTREHIEAGLREARWPCRLERVLDDPPVIIDVAHNPGGIARLVEAIPKMTAVAAVSADKDVQAMLQCLAPHVDRLILSQVSMHRRMPVEQLSEAARAAGIAHETAGALNEAIAMAMASASPEAPLVITGSVFTAGEARALLEAEYGVPQATFG